jgi:small conductance mechanosensitive channel
MLKRFITILMIAFTINLSAYFVASAQNYLPFPDPATISNPNIPVDYLELLLDPLTKAELDTELHAWRDLVKAKATEIAKEEIATRDKRKEIDSSEQVKNNEAKEARIQSQKDYLLKDLTILREQKNALLERLDAVVRAFELKGGDADEIKKYAKAVSGIKVEVKDTSATWSAITGWLTSKEGGIKLGLHSLKFLVIVLVFWIMAKVAGSIIFKMTEKSAHMSALLKSFLNTMIKRTFIFVGLLIALSTSGVEVGAMLALLGGGAFILGFALQDTLGNFAAGMMLLLYRPFDVGDVVEVGGIFGKVDRVSLVNTTIRTFDNKIVIVPNKQVWGQVITNSTASKIRRVDMVFGISYSDDIEQAHSILARLVDAHPLIRKEPEAVIELHTLGESSVDFICRPWCQTEDYWRVYWDMTKQVKQAFDTCGVSIPFPQRDVHIYQSEPVKPTSDIKSLSTHDSSQKPTDNESAPA